MALARRDGAFRLGIRRAIEQVVTLLPSMVFALIAAGFLVKLIPTEFISGQLGAGAGFRAILIGSLAGLIIPSGPVITFAIAASLAEEGASVPALIAFITSWSLFTAHRVLIYEIPLLGTRFVRLRMLSNLPIPFLAGAIAMLWT
jgi:uncharacterized membrane protein YraQ (UPF0718 family)